MIMMSVMRSARRLRRISGGSPRALTLACAALLTNCLIAPSGLAQVVALNQPEFVLIDPNSVDLQSATTYLHETDLSIGSKDNPLTHTMYSGPAGEWTLDYPSFLPQLYQAQMDDFASAFIQQPTCPYKGPQIYATVIVGHSSETFGTGFASQCRVFTPTKNTGDTLVYSSGLTYTMRDGTQVIFAGPNAGATHMIYPDGRVLTYGYDSAGVLQSVTRSDGLQLKYTYATGFNGKAHLTGVTAINNAYEYCNPTAATCSLTKNWPKSTYSFAAAPNNGETMTVTDSRGAVTVYTMDSSGRTTGIQLPSSKGGNNITYNYCNSGCTQYSSYPVGANPSNYVLSVVRDSPPQTWKYSGGPAQQFPNNFQAFGTTATYGYTSPVGGSSTVVINVCEDANDLFDGPTCMERGRNPLVQLTDDDGVVYLTDGFHGLIKSATKPEGNQTQYTWDGRSNLTNEVLNPKPGSSLTSIPLAANYDTTCTYPVKCNQPNWVKDGLGNETDYTYDTTHGGVLTKTLPADANGFRPQTTYTYTPLHAWVLNSSGTYVQSAAPIYLRSTETICRTSKANPTGSATPCAVQGDEVVKTYQYGPNSGPNNLFVRGVSVAADGATHTTCYGYDIYGNRTSETEPLAGLTTCP